MILKKPKTDRIYKLFLHDVGLEIKEQAQEAAAAKKKYDDPFNHGKVEAYNLIIRAIQHEARACKIRLKDLGLDDIDPDKDL